MHRLIIVFFIAALHCSCKDSPPSVQQTNSGNGDLLIGIDISHHQKKIDWNKVKEWKGNPIQFVYIKATEGATYQDKKYQTYLKGAKENGFKVGSYHYFRTSSSPEDQFKNYKQHVKKDMQDLIPMVDVEDKKKWNTKTFHKNLQIFLDLVEDHYGVKPMIYCVNSFYNLNLSRGYEDYKFMVGRYGPNQPNMRHGGPWTIWQFSETGKINGIERPVDIDKLNPNYTLEDLLLHQ